MKKTIQRQSALREYRSLPHSNTSALVCAVLIIGLTVSAQGFCDGAASEMDKMATNVVDTIFSPWVRRTALAFGGGFGIFRSIGSGSFMPFFTWGGIGLLINYIPKLINFLSTLGA